MNPLNPYSIIILLTGLILAIFCIILIIYDNKKLLSYLKLAGEREQQLKEVINDAELIIEELNKFSNYVINEMERKKTEYKDTMQCIEADIGELNQKTGELLNSLNGIQQDMALLKEEKSKDEQQNLQEQEEPSSLNSKYSEVLRLSREGVKAAEIARRLSMGKGEVRLVLKSSNSGYTNPDELCSRT